MSILTKTEIEKEIEKGGIKIEPYSHENIGPGSVDLRLSNKFRIFNKSNSIVEVTEETDYKEYTQLISADSIVIMPNETILGMTMERISLAPYICGWLEGRSRFARLGLLVHISASYMQPGISNHQVLELTNNSNVPLRLHAGTRICQFIFEKTIGEAQYTGKFLNQTEP